MDKSDTRAHYEREATQAELAAELVRLREQVAELAAALEQFEQCDLNEGNCASLEVATRRIRGIARAALAKVKP